MDILQSDIIDDIFIEICRHTDLEQLLGLQLLSKYNKKLIRKTRWVDICINLYDTINIDDIIIYLATNFNFACYDLSICIFTDKSLKLLVNCHTLYLAWCRHITDECIQTLREKGVNVIENDEY